jgi:hypothetical protein
LGTELSTTRRGSVLAVFSGVVIVDVGPLPPLPETSPLSRRKATCRPFAASLLGWIATKYVV